MTLQGYPRSLILAQIESMYGTSYWFSIVTLVLCIRVAEILKLLYAESHFFGTHSYSSQNFRMFPWYWGLQRANTPGYLIVKLFSKNSNLRDHNPPTLQTGRETDGQTTCRRNTALYIASPGKIALPSLAVLESHAGFSVSSRITSYKRIVTLLLYDEWFCLFSVNIKLPSVTVYAS